MVNFFVAGTTVAMLATLQGCATRSYREYPARVAPVDPASLNFQDIARATDSAGAVTIIGLRRVEKGIHVVFGIEVPPSFEAHQAGPFASGLETIRPTAIELLNGKGEQILLRSRRVEDDEADLSIHYYYYYPLKPVAGNDRRFYYETRFVTDETLPSGTYRVRAVTSEFWSEYPLQIDPSPRQFAPVYVPPLRSPY